MPSQSAGFPQLNHKNGKPGRPTKRTPKLIAELLKKLEAGSPINLACTALGISSVTFGEWRRIDPELGQRVEQAIACGLCEVVTRLREHGKENWGATAWELERRLPEVYAKKDPQLMVGIQNNISGNGNGVGMTFEAVVLSDLEYVQLGKHPGYQKTEGSVREVETEVISPEVDGSLRKDGFPGVIVISESAAALHDRRLAKANAQWEAYLDRRRASEASESSSQANIETVASSLDQAVPESTVHSVNNTADGLLTIREGDETRQAFWRHFTTGDDHRPVERATAVRVCHLVSSACGSRARIRFDDDQPITVGDLLNALNQATGASAWQWLQRRAGH
jgi:hypothetical protein